MRVTGKKTWTDFRKIVEADMTLYNSLVPFAKITKILDVRTDSGPLKLPDGIGASHNNSG